MDNHSTGNLWLASYLICEGMKLINIEVGQQGLKKAKFILEGEGIKELVGKYENNALCGVLILKDNLNILRRQMFRALDRQ